VAQVTNHFPLFLPFYSPHSPHSPLTFSLTLLTLSHTSLLSEGHKVLFLSRHFDTLCLPMNVSRMSLKEKNSILRSILRHHRPTVALLLGLSTAFFSVLTNTLFPNYLPPLETLFSSLPSLPSASSSPPPSSSSLFERWIPQLVVLGVLGLGIRYTAKFAMRKGLTTTLSKCITIQEEILTGKYYYVPVFVPWCLLILSCPSFPSLFIPLVFVIFLVLVVLLLFLPFPYSFSASSTFQPDIVVGSSWGGAVALELVAKGSWTGPTLLLAPAHGTPSSSSSLLCFR
jgi:hypothetical protein